MNVNLTKIDLATINLAKINLAKIDFAGSAGATPVPVDYSTEYFTVEVPVGTKLYMLSGTQYSYNKSTWTECTNCITMEAPKVYLKKTGSTYSTDTYRIPAVYIKDNYDMVISGNILSLIYGDDFKSYTEMPSGCHFKYCFNSYLTNTTGTTNVGYYSATDARNLVLPSNTQKSCYEGMFGCHNTVSEQTIRSLKYPPKLPAMVMTSYCHLNMFFGCQDLENAPELPATTLADYCYYEMFNYTKITEIKAHFKTISGVTNPVTYWLSNVTTTGTLYLPTDYTGTTPSIPSTWTISKTL